MKFSTNINLSTVSSFNENAGAVEFVFPVQEHLYKAIDALPEAVTEFSIDDIKIFAPTLSGSEDITVSLRMAYKKSSLEIATPLLSADALAGAKFKVGDYSITKGYGFTSFNSTLLSDINSAVSLREFINLLFIIKIKIDGPGASLINIDDLDLQVDLYAKVATIAPALGAE